MIVQTFMVILVISATLLCDVIGESFSNVYVEREIVPMRYYQYGPPYPSMANPRLSQINTLPSISGYVAPCVSPCVYPSQTVATVNPSQNILTYNAPAPTVPIVVTPTKKEAKPYEYSYVVYDENTGDHKAQRELSDGSVVRGEYSFLQPDGYVREVQYIADDISGFNAVVNNFLPVAGEGKRKVEGHEKKESSPPCHENKNESQKEEDPNEITTKQLMRIHENLHRQHSSKESVENPKEYHHGKSKDLREESKVKHFKEAFVDHSEKKEHMKPKHPKLDHESKENSKEIHHTKATKESNEPEEDSRGESLSEESREDSKEKSRKKSGDKPSKGSKVASDENIGQRSETASHGKHKEVHELLKPTDEARVPYKDILRCIEAAMKREYGLPAAMRQGPSPLTYIILKNPC